MNVFTFKQQAQDFILRLFIDSSVSSGSSASSDYCTGAHCGTFTRLHV